MTRQHDWMLQLKDYKMLTMKKVLLSAACLLLITAAQSQVQGKIEKAKVSSEQGLKKAEDNKAQAEKGLEKAQGKVEEGKEAYEKGKAMLEEQKEKLDPEGEKEAELREMIRKESVSEDIATSTGKSKKEVLEMQSMTEEEMAKKAPEEALEIKKVKAQTKVAESNEKVASAKMKIQAAQEKLEADIKSGAISTEEAMKQKARIQNAIEAVKALNTSIRETNALTSKK